MRINLDRKHFTKSERRFGRRLQESHIPFRTKVLVSGHEIDFLIGKYAIDIDGHPQDVNKNILLANEGYTPIHIGNESVNKINITFLL